MWLRRRRPRYTQNSLKSSVIMHPAGARVSERLSLSPSDILEGAVDDLNRPYCRIEIPHFSDPLLAFIDTGFNGAIVIDELQAEKLSFHVFKNQTVGVRLAN